MNQTSPTLAAPRASDKGQWLLAILGAIARLQGRVAELVRRIPGWPAFEWAAEQAARPVKALADHALRRIPRLRRAEWLLETERLRQMNAVVLTVTLVIALWRGLQTTPLGHIGTDPLIYPLLGSISCFNPFLGFVSALAFGAGDITQKLLVNDIYDGRGPRHLAQGANYWGAMIGYVVAYSAAMVMGLLPGVLSRVGRHLVRLNMRRFFFRRAAAMAAGAEPLDGRAWKIFSRTRPDGGREAVVATGPSSDGWAELEGPFTWSEAWARQAELAATGRFVVPPVSAALRQKPPEVKLNDPATRALLEGLRQRGLLNDPDSWRSQPLAPAERRLLGYLRGHGLLHPDSAAQLDALKAPPGPEMDAQPGGEYPIPELCGGMLGAGLGGSAAVLAAMGLEFPAFYLRPSPDTSCYAAEVNHYLLGRLPLVGGLVAAGGTVANTVLTPQQGGPSAGSGPSSGQPVGPDDARRINQLNVEVQDPDLYRRLQAVIDRAQRTGTVDPGELAAIAQAQDELANQRHAQIVDDQTKATEDWRLRQAKRHEDEAKQEALQRQAADLINHGRDVITRMEDPVRRRFLEDLFESYARRNAGDPAQIERMNRVIRGEVGDQHQAEARRNLDAADGYEAWENTSRTVRNGAGFVIQTYLGGLSPTGVAGLIRNAAIGGAFGAGNALSDGADARSVLFQATAGAGGSLFSAVSAPGVLVNAAIGAGQAMMDGKTDPRDLLRSAGAVVAEGAVMHWVFTGGARVAEAVGERVGALRERLSGGKPALGSEAPLPVERVSPGGPRPFVSEPNHEWIKPPERSTPGAAAEGRLPPEFGSNSPPQGPNMPRLNQVVSDIERLSGKDKAYEYLQNLRRQNVLTDKQFDALRARWDNPVHDATVNDAWRLYRDHPGQAPTRPPGPWTPQVERADCAVATVIDAARAIDPHLTYEDAERVLNGFRRQRGGGELGGLPPDQIRPALDALAAARGWSSTPARLAEALGTRNPAEVGARLGEFFTNNPGSRIFAGVRTPDGNGHMVTITGVDANGRIQVIDPWGGRASFPPDQLHIYPEHSHVLGGPAEPGAPTSGGGPAAAPGGESPSSDLAGIRPGGGRDALEAQLRQAGYRGRKAADLADALHDLREVPGADRWLKDLEVGDSTAQGATGELRWAVQNKDRIKEVQLRNGSQKGADFHLQDGSVLEVKKLDWSSSFYHEDFGKEMTASQWAKQLASRYEANPNATLRVAVFERHRMPAGLEELVKAKLRAKTGNPNLNVHFEGM